MEHFVSIIVSNTTLDESLVESVLDSAQVGLLEDETEYSIGETDSGENILRVGLHKELSEEEADEFAESLAEKLFDLGYDQFDIEVSGGDLKTVAEAEEGQVPFDVIDDMAVYMRNDPMMYRKTFFPAVLKMQDLVKQKKKFKPEQVLGSAVDTAMNSYCKKFKLGRPERIFKDTDRAEIIQKIYGEEMTNIRKGVYS